MQERGQTSAEWMGVLLLVSAIVAALVAATPSLGATISCDLHKEIARIGGGTAPTCGGGAAAKKHSPGESVHDRACRILGGLYSVPGGYDPPPGSPPDPQVQRWREQCPMPPGDDDSGPRCSPGDIFCSVFTWYIGDPFHNWCDLLGDTVPWSKVGGLVYKSFLRKVAAGMASKRAATTACGEFSH